ncbi:hypothetical protein sos41_10110 [Alphaproteobacteria bacterium SO-S41]|nr:hypothetical protein sos41_10110 [Alphaproteobacteria bacterium SO-S41]
MSIMRMAAVFGCAVLGGALLPALASDKADSDVLAKYNRTETYENCINIQRIQNSRILNDHQILFEMAGDTVYLNEPENCPSLNKSLGLGYDATTGDLCTTTIVHLIDPGSPAGDRGSCGLSKFQKLEKKPAP